MIRRPPRSTRTDTLFPYTTRFRSAGFQLQIEDAGVAGDDELEFLRGIEVEPQRNAESFAQRRGQQARAGGGAHQGEGRQVDPDRSEEYTSELQSLMRISYAVFCLKKKQEQY